MKRMLSTVLFVVFVLTLGTVMNAQLADRVYLNGNIYRVDEAFSTASALAVQDGTFIYVGNDAGVQVHIGPLTLVSDLKGQTVIPGLQDAHAHINFGEKILYPRTPDIRASIGEWASVERMQEVIKRCLTTGEGMRPGPEPRWLVLDGWMSDVWDPPVFRKELIDAVAPDNPVYIKRYTHGSGANSKALELAGITRDTPDPEGGHIKKDEKGEPTGEFVERAPPQLTRLIPSLPPMTDYELSRNLVEGTQLAIASGLTAIHDASRTSYEELQRRMKLYEVGLLRIRINEMVNETAAIKLGEPVNLDNKYVVHNPFYTLHAAVTRQDRDNNPPGGWFSEQAMTREEALRAATMGGAYLMHAENILGSIEVGKLADFVVIPVDYMTIPAEDIWKIEPEMTVIGGEVVYSKALQ